MKREPLLSDEQIVQVGLGVFDRASVKKSRPLQHLYNAKYCGAAQVRDHYEAARAKDAELIQRLVDAIMDNASYRLLTEGEEGDTVSDFMNVKLTAGEAGPVCPGLRLAIVTRRVFNS